MFFHISFILQTIFHAIRMSDGNSSSSISDVEVQKFKAQQRQGWDSAAEGWKKWWKTIEEGAQVVSDKLVDLAQIQQGDKVLDIGTGIGEPSVTAARKVGSNGKVLAVDISAQMLAIAKERARDSGVDKIIEFKEADAESFTLPSSNFDAILSRYGLMFLPNLSNALAAMHQALVPDGRIAAAVWSSPQRVPFLNLAIGTAMKEVGLSATPPAMRGPFSLADTDSLQDKFRQAGFHDVTVHVQNVDFKFVSAEDYTSFHQAVTAPIKMMISNQTLQRQSEIWNTITDAARRHADSTGTVNLPGEAICIAARR